MMYKAIVVVCFELHLRTNHSMHSEHHIEFFNVKTWWYIKKPLGLERLFNGSF
jgi:hypothetical protein